MKRALSIVCASILVATYLFLVACSSPQAPPAVDAKQPQKSEAQSSSKTEPTSSTSASTPARAAQPAATKSQSHATAVPAGPQATKPPAKVAAASKELSAKEVYPQLIARASQWASDAVPVEIGVPYRVGVDPVNNGRSTSLTGHFYSASKQQTWVFHYFQGQLLAAGSPMLTT